MFDFHPQNFEQLSQRFWRVEKSFLINDLANVIYAVLICLHYRLA